MELLANSQLRYVAADVRQWAEGHGDEHWDLTGWCAIAAGRLFTLFQGLGIKAEIHAWLDPSSTAAHVYVVVDDHVVDVTATQFKQFRNKPVVIMHQREAAEYDFYNTVHVFHSVKELRKWQRQSGWPPHQVAFAH